MKIPRTHGYGLVLALAAISIVFQMAAEGAGLIRWITILLQAATLVAAVRAAHPERAAVRLASAVAAFATAAALVTLIVTGEIPEAPTAIVSGLLVAVAPAVLVGGLVREVRTKGVTIHTLSGGLAIYLLVGMFFAFVYGTVEAIDNGTLFAQVHDASPADRMYFSFVTMCTVGYGDLTLIGNTPRSFAVVEMLFGQIYLVTIVALIVTNLGGARRAAS
jgi:hypothetical protein